MGTVQKRGKSYKLRVYAGKDINGKQIEHSMTWTPPADMSAKTADKEAHKQLILFEERIKNGATANGRMKFVDFADLWFETYANPQLRPKTVSRYRILMTRINLAIGHLRLEAIQPMTLLTFYNTLRKTVAVDSNYRCTADFKAVLDQNLYTQKRFSEVSGLSLTTLNTIQRNKPVSLTSATKVCEALRVPLTVLFEPCDMERPLSATTVQHYHRLVSNILNSAVKWGYIPYNPASRIDPPRSEAPDIVYLDDRQAKDFFTYMAKAPGYYRRPAILLLLTGLRRSELLGLEWADIDFKAKTMHIVRTSQVLPDKGVFTDTTKNKSSKRVVMISDQCVKILQEQYEWQLLQKQRLKSKWQGSLRIVTDQYGAPLNPDRFTHWFSAYIRRETPPDFPKIHLHSLRHTYATLCIAKGIPLTAVAQQLGHANISTTAKIYAHAIRSSQIAATETIGNLFDEFI